MMRLERPLDIETETKSQVLTLIDIPMEFVREERRIVPRNTFSEHLDVRDVLPDVVLPLGDIWPARRTFVWQRQVRQVCPARWCVYVIRDAKVTLYIGMTGNGLHRRISQHFHGRSELGMLLRYGGSECLDFTTEQYLMPDKATALHYEGEMIRYRSPVLNIAQNPSSRMAS